MVDDVKILLFDEPLANLDPATGKQAIELIDTHPAKTDTIVLIIEHRLEDVLWRNVVRIVLVNEGRILADMRPDDLLSGSLLAENGIREPLYLTAMRYAGIAVTPEKHPAHIDSVVLDKADTARLLVPGRAAARPQTGPGAAVGSTRPLLWLQQGSAYAAKRQLFHRQGRDGQHRGAQWRGKSTLSKLICGFETQDSGEIYLNGKDLKMKTSAAAPSTLAT